MPKNIRGWTLVESMVVLSIVAVMAAWALPSFMGTIQQARLAAATHEFLSAISLARSEAIKRNARTVLCVAVSENACTSTGNWNQGWLLFEDVNSNGSLDSTEKIIRYQSALHGGVVIKGNTPVAKYVSFLGTGRPHLLSGAMQAGTISICHRANTPVTGRAIVMNVVGRPRVQVWMPLSTCE